MPTREQVAVESVKHNNICKANKQRVNRIVKSMRKDLNAALYKLAKRNYAAFMKNTLETLPTEQPSITVTITLNMPGNSKPIVLELKDSDEAFHYKF